jgi:hypothetical protein
VKGESVTRKVPLVIKMRDAARVLLHAQATDASDADIANLQADLTWQYDVFVRNHGFLHELANAAIIRQDDDASLVFALEQWDADEKTAKKSDIFTKRLIKVEKAPTSAATPSDAVAISLNESGVLDIGRVSTLLGTDRADAERRHLGVRTRRRTVGQGPGDHPERAAAGAQARRAAVLGDGDADRLRHPGGQRPDAGAAGPGAVRRQPGA